MRDTDGPSVRRRTRPPDRTAIGDCDCLMPQTHAEYRQICAEGFDHINANTRLIGTRRPGRYDDRLWAQAHNVFKGDTAAVLNLNVCTGQSQVASKIVDETVSIIQHQDHASSTAVRTAPMIRSAFSRTSPHSAAASESKVIPAPDQYLSSSGK